MSNPGFIDSRLTFTQLLIRTAAFGSNYLSSLLCEQEKISLACSDALQARVRAKKQREVVYKNKTQENRMQKW